MKYTIQCGADGCTVFDENSNWVGVFRTYTHANKFIKLILQGEVAE